MPRLILQILILKQNISLLNLKQKMKNYKYKMLSIPVHFGGLPNDMKHLNKNNSKKK